MTSGLSCDGESVALTAATSPSLEDLTPGDAPRDVPRMVLYNSLLAYETGAEFVQAWLDAEAGSSTRSCSCSRVGSRTRS